MRRLLNIIGMVLVGSAWAQYFEPPPMNPDPVEECVPVEEEETPPAQESEPHDSPEDDNTQPVAREKTRVAVLGYHNFSNTKPVTEMLMRTSEFRKQMEHIREAGLRVISMKEFLEWRMGHLKLPAKCVLITLDDGWRSVYTDAFPILKEYGYPFTLFLYTKYLSGRGDSMTPAMVREMQQHGATIGSHSTSHYYPSTWKEGLERGEQAFAELMDVEMGDSFKRLSELFGPINAYCYPGGYVTPEIVRQLPSYGYVVAFTVIPGKVDVQEDVLQVHRYMVFGNDSSVFQRAVDFSWNAANSQQVARAHRNSPVPPFPVYPAPNADAYEDLPVISAQMGAVQNIDLSSVQMAVSGFGRVPSKLDSSSGTVQWNPPLRLYQSPVVVELSWKETGGTPRKTSWYFNVKLHTELPHENHDENTR